MKTNFWKFFTILVLPAISGIHLYGQAEGRALFLDKIKYEIKQMDSAAVIYNYRRSINNRKIFIEGGIAKRDISFRCRIKYFKGGLKKEKMKYYNFQTYNGFNFMYVVKINDKFHFIKYYTSGKDKKYNFVKLSKEILIDERLYQKTQLH